MKTKTLNLIFILCLLLTACSSEQVDNADDLVKEEISNTINIKAGGPGNCILPEDPVLLQVTYADHVTTQQKIAIRNQYRDFVGLVCILQSNHDDVDEVWVADAGIYYSYCKACDEVNKCCRDVVIEDEDDDIEKIQQ